MRNFVAVIAIAAITAVVVGRREFVVRARDVDGSAPASRSTIVRLSDIAARPLQRVLPPLPPPLPKPPVNVYTQPFEKKLSAQAAIAVDHVTDEVLFEKNADAPRPLASVTKLMSALLLAERITDWSATTTISADVVEEGNQAVGRGETYTHEDLYGAALVGSLNTAVRALVQATGMSEAEFVVLMNRRARDLGMTHTMFADATGLSAGNVGSARDVARLTKIALSHPRIKVTSVRDQVSIFEQGTKKEKIVRATDWLLTQQQTRLTRAHVEGGKTGYTPDAGFNFSVQIMNDRGREIRVVVLGAQDVYARFTEAADLANWVFENFVWVK